MDWWEMDCVWAQMFTCPFSCQVLPHFCNLVSIRGEEAKGFDTECDRALLNRTSSVLPDGCVKQNFWRYSSYSTTLCWCLLLLYFFRVTASIAVVPTNYWEYFNIKGNGVFHPQFEKCKFSIIWEELQKLFKIEKICLYYKGRNFHLATGRSWVFWLGTVQVFHPPFCGFLKSQKLMSPKSLNQSSDSKFEVRSSECTPKTYDGC